MEFTRAEPHDPDLPRQAPRKKDPLLPPAGRSAPDRRTREGTMQVTMVPERRRPATRPRPGVGGMDAGGARSSAHTTVCGSACTSCTTVLVANAPRPPVPSPQHAPWPRGSRGRGPIVAEHGSDPTSPGSGRGQGRRGPRRRIRLPRLQTLPARQNKSGRIVAVRPTDHRPYVFCAWAELGSKPFATSRPLCYGRRRQDQHWRHRRMPDREQLPRADRSFSKFYGAPRSGASTRSPTRRH